MIERFRDWQRARPTVADLVATLTCLALGLPIALTAAYQQHKSVSLTVLVLVLSCLPLLLRSRRPIPVAAATVLAAELSYALTPSVAATPLSVIFALYWVAVTTDRVTAWRVGFGSAAVLLVSGLLFRPGLDRLAENLGVLGWTGAAVAVGDALRSRRELIASYRDRAERAECTKEDEARRRVTEERIRIARELHDVVAHHITLVNAQAGVAHHLMRRDPEHAYQALERIRDTSRAALDELRATVGLLRGREEGEEPHEPTPGLADLPALLDSFRHAGLTVGLERTGPVEELPQLSELTAYRIVQEALTNTHKHAGAGAALVRLAAGPAALTVTVTDDGIGGGRPGHGGLGHGGGHGMIGMHERARAVGGTLSAGPRPGGGFRVHAELPLRPKG
ncbi:two-component sensor histidine kinase [Kitasatospora sp. MMS16-BH015]|uniref:sensor histidine kinase n=1 Tax=Kitasatospora sp. MMS16-BH015 TaxID=2018025 RepID=UPI000CA31197|nr:histidine kinase [Kitasatospora sp. MMS16-BH015]AUG75434.1 two-component sensor histidine kinase [Kitasatospora sp. MMS16-BH015]